MVGVSKAALEQKCGLSRKEKPEPEGAGLSPAATVLTTPEGKGWLRGKLQLGGGSCLGEIFEEMKKMRRLYFELARF